MLLVASLFLPPAAGTETRDTLCMDFDPARVKYKCFAPSLLPSPDGTAGWSRGARPCAPDCTVELTLVMDKVQQRPTLCTDVWKVRQHIFPPQQCSC